MFEMIFQVLAEATQMGNHAITKNSLLILG